MSDELVDKVLARFPGDLEWTLCCWMVESAYNSRALWRVSKFFSGVASGVRPLEQVSKSQKELGVVAEEWFVHLFITVNCEETVLGCTHFQVELYGRQEEIHMDQWRREVNLSSFWWNLLPTHLTMETMSFSLCASCWWFWQSLKIRGKKSGFRYLLQFRLDNHVTRRWNWDWELFAMMSWMTWEPTRQNVNTSRWREGKCASWTRKNWLWSSTMEGLVVQKRSEVLHVVFAFGHRLYIGEHDLSVACWDQATK